MSRFLSLLGCVFTATIAFGHVAIPMQQPIAENRMPAIPLGYTEQQLTTEGVPVASFGYTKNIGPMSWYGMNPSANSHCATGSSQSPINIDTNNNTLTNHGVWLNIPSLAEAEIENLGNTIEVNLTGMGTMIYPFPNGDVYKLQQLHFHTPSEHRFNGIHTELEMHIVFKDCNGAVAVLSQHFNVGTWATYPLLASLLKNVAEVTVPGSTSTTGPLDFGPIITEWADSQSWTYTGSLTTPPCSEGVKWFVQGVGQWVDVPTYRAIRNIMGFNARVLQNQFGGENLLMGAGKSMKANGII